MEHRITPYQLIKVESQANLMTLRQELRKEVKQATEAYISSVAKEGSEEVPTERIYTVSDSPLNIVREKEIPRPSNATASDLRDYSNGEFEPIAHKIANQLDVEHVPEVDVDEDGMVATGHSDVEREFERALMEFAGLVMDYSGTFDFDESAFSTAYEENFFPQYTDRELVEVIIPVRHVVIDESVDLTDEFELNSSYFGPYTVCNIEISPLSDLELDGMANFNEGLGSSAAPRIAPNYEIAQKLRFDIHRRPRYRDFSQRFKQGIPDSLESEEITVTPLERLTGHVYRDLIQELAATTKRVLRLESPRCDPIFESAYISVPRFLRYRDLAIDIVDKHPIDGGNGDVDGTVVLSEDRVTEFKSFWNRYVNLLSEGDNQFVRPLLRFEEMFRKGREEDQLLDCLIALERTLLTDTSQASSYTFRMGVRAGILLDESQRDSDWTRNMTYEFFRELYGIRGDIVHNDITVYRALEAIDDSVVGELESPSQLLALSRELLANILLRYMDHKIDHGMSIHETNQAIDRAVKHADYSPET